MNSYTSNPTANDNLDLEQLMKEERYARTLANIARRAETLWDDGYTMEPTTLCGIYAIKTPRGDTYEVVINSAVADECNCPAWEKYGICKHFLAVQWVLREEAEAAAWDALMANAEAATGCDPHAEF